MNGNYKGSLVACRQIASLLDKSTLLCSLLSKTTPRNRLGLSTQTFSSRTRRLPSAQALSCRRHNKTTRHNTAAWHEHNGLVVPGRTKTRCRPIAQTTNRFPATRDIPRRVRCKSEDCVPLPPTLINVMRMLERLNSRFPSYHYSLATGNRLPIMPPNAILRAMFASNSDA